MYIAAVCSSASLIERVPPHQQILDVDRHSRGERGLCALCSSAVAPSSAVLRIHSHYLPQRDQQQQHDARPRHRRRHRSSLRLRSPSERRCAIQILLEDKYYSFFTCVLTEYPVPLPGYPDIPTGQWLSVRGRGLKSKPPTTQFVRIKRTGISSSDQRK